MAEGAFEWQHLSAEHRLWSVYFAEMGQRELSGGHSQYINVVRSHSGYDRRRCDAMALLTVKSMVADQTITWLQNDSVKSLKGC